MLCLLALKLPPKPLRIEDLGNHGKCWEVRAASRFTVLSSYSWWPWFPAITPQVRSLGRWLVNIASILLSSFVHSRLPWWVHGDNYLPSHHSSYTDKISSLHLPSLNKKILEDSVEPAATANKARLLWFSFCRDRRRSEFVCGHWR